MHGLVHGCMAGLVHGGGDVVVMCVVGVGKLHVCEVGLGGWWRSGW